MEEPRSGQHCPSCLRVLALDQIRNQATASQPLSPEGTARLIHELQVHQIELELQNEELRTVQGDLEATQRRYSDLYHRAPVGYCTLTPSGTITDVNQTLVEMLGTQTTDLLGKRLTAVVATEDQDKVYLFLKALGEQTKAPPVVLRLRRGKGFFWSRVEAIQLVEETGGQTVLRLAVSDITSERLQEEAVRMAEKLETTESLAGGIAHDFNNLLGGIYGYLTLARDHGNPGQEMLRYLDKADAVFVRAKALTQRLMTFTKRNAPTRTSLAFAPVVAKSVAFALDGTQTSSVLDLPKDLWGVSGDETQIAQVIDNLVRNASQAMDQAGGITIAARNTEVEEGNRHHLKPQRYVELTVADSGPGISPEVLPRIFDPFFTTKATGHGLGLATCQSIVVRHDGALWVESEGRQGATFHLLLPACWDQPSTSDSAPLGHHGSGTLLLMDDEEFFRDILSDYLQRLGYTVIAVANGDEALAVPTQTPPLKAAILDLKILGKRGGGDILGPLREHHRGIPVFAISGFSEDQVMTRPQAFGFQASLQKPFQFAELSAFLENQLGSDPTSSPGLPSAH